MKERLRSIMQAQTGDAGLVYKDLVTGDGFQYNAQHPFVAASVIKLPILVNAFERMHTGEISADECITVRSEHHCPSCGALSYMHDGLQVTFLDLCTLMIILSDNTATNLLIDKLGVDSINQTMRRHGMKKSTLRRKLFDAEKSAQGIENTVTPGEIAQLLERMYRGQLVSPQSDEQMLTILKNQRLNGKMPFFIPSGVPIAHKTGEDGGITHDCGIIFAHHPLLLCFMSEHTRVPQFERCIQDVSQLVYENCPIRQ